MFLRRFSLILFLAVICLPLLAQEFDPQDLYAKSAILMDANTGYVIFERNADEEISPASLTKIMTLYLTYEAIEEGRFELGSKMSVSRRAGYRAQERGSSVMFLEPGQSPTLFDLMLGLAVASGNDAAVAVAENISGSVENFVKQMNQKIAGWGLDQTFFVEPSGINPKNKVTAREYAIVVQKYLHNFPQALDQIHNVKVFVYPRRENWAPRGRKWHYTFENKIPLLFDYQGADGLKTGYISESGYNLVSTAQRGDTRLLGVVLGVRAPGVNTGNARRREDMMRMMDFGFAHYESVNVNRYLLDTLPPVRIFGGQKRTVKLQPKDPVYITLKKGQIPVPLKELKKIRWFIDAPFAQDEVVKKVNVNAESIEGTQKLKLEFVATGAVKMTNWLLWLQDYSTYLLKSCLTG